MIRQIAAMDAKRGIATANGIPWSLPGDAAYFENQTVEGIIVMGWATYNEFAGPLHDRENYVLTRDATPLRSGFAPIAGLDDLTSRFPDRDVWVIGGAAVYAQTINRADQLYLTQVLADFNCTKFFPDYSSDFVRFDQSEVHTDDGVRYRFEKWRRSD